MNRFEIRVDPLTQELYYSVSLHGIALLQDPLLNKGHSFPPAERDELGLRGLLPYKVGTLEEQVRGVAGRERHLRPRLQALRPRRARREDLRGPQRRRRLLRGRALRIAAEPFPRCTLARP
jgi:hypothetical protein